MKKIFSVESVADDLKIILREKPGLIKNIGIFGSLARGDFNKKSDIDLLVEYDVPPIFSLDTFHMYCWLCNVIRETLKNTYHRSVDIVHIEDGSLDSLYDPDAKNEVIWI